MTTKETEMSAKPETQVEREELIDWLEQSADQCAVFPSTAHEAKRYRQAAALLSAGPARVEPMTTFVRNLAKAYTDEARGLLDETYRFASQSPRGRDNINAVLQLLDDIDSALEPSKPVHGIGKDQA